MRDILDIDAEGPATAVCVSQTLRIAFGQRIMRLRGGRGRDDERKKHIMMMLERKLRKIENKIGLSSLLPPPKVGDVGLPAANRRPQEAQLATAHPPQPVRAVH